MFVPPIATALVALLIVRENAAALAYVSGSLGTLIGADLLNLDAVRWLGAPVASIGGAGKSYHSDQLSLPGDLTVPSFGPWCAPSAG